jgi:hypothetical protein
MRRRFPIVAAALLALGACKPSGPSDEESRALVKAYLEKLVQAYRASDEELVDRLVTENEARKLIGLIGVKRDVGVVLDAELLELAFLRVERRDGAAYVDTRERWHYRDRAIGSGAQVGDESTDEYQVRYRLVRDRGALKVDQLEFVAEPKVGRKPAPIRLDQRTAHGLPPKEEEEKAAAPGNEAEKAAAHGAEAKKTAAPPAEAKKPAAPDTASRSASGGSR